MHATTRLRPSAGALLLLLAACGSGKPAASPAATPTPAAAKGPPPVALPAPVPTTTSTRATLKLDASWARCHEGFTVAAGKDAASEASRLAQGCAAVTRMRRVEPALTGTQSAASRPQTFRWKAEGGHCYRAYGVGGPGIVNLDILVADSNGAVLGQDGNDGAAPVVLEGGAICFKQDDEAAVVVSVGDGTGEFAVEVWED